MFSNHKLQNCPDISVTSFDYNGEEIRKRLRLSNFDLAVLARRNYHMSLIGINQQISQIRSLELRARRAYEIRHQARVFARNISGLLNKSMAYARDYLKYGNIHGPTFEGLYKKGVDKGLRDE